MFLKIFFLFILCLFFDGSKINLSELEVLFVLQRRVGAIVQGGRGSGSGQAGVRTARQLRPAGGGVMKSWAGLPAHCQETGAWLRRLGLARSQEQETGVSQNSG